MKFALSGCSLFKSDARNASAINKVRLVGGESLEMANWLQPKQLRLCIALTMPPPNIKRLILTTAVVSITITGTLYGAGLKTDQEIAEV